jgi:hypothetical protein
LPLLLQNAEIVPTLYFFVLRCLRLDPGGWTAERAPGPDDGYVFAAAAVRIVVAIAVVVAV